MPPWLATVASGGVQHPEPRMTTSDESARVRRNNLREARDDRGWDQEEAAAEIYRLGLELGFEEKQLGIDARQVSRWERGVVAPGPIYATILTRLYERSPDQLDLPPHVLPVNLPGPPRPVPIAETANPAAMASTTAALEADMKRRPFARYLALVGGIGLLRPDSLTTLFNDGRTDADEAVADRLSQRSLQYIGQWDRLPPTVLLAAVIGHLDEIQMAMNRSRSPAIVRELRVIASETAAFAGMLGWFLQDRGLAEIGLSMADDYAQATDHTTVRTTVLAIRADFHSYVQLGQHAGSGISRSMLEAAELAAGKSPTALRAWILMRQAEEHAVIGQEAQARQLLDAADTAFAGVEMPQQGMFAHWSLDMHHAFRGNCEQLLGRYNDSIDILSPVLQRIDPGAVSNRIALQTDMAAVHARQGDPEHASALLMRSLSAAAEAGLRERVKRISGIRSSLLEPFRDSPAVRRLDDQLRVILPTDPAART